jgi:hypothetical protein
VAYHLNHNRNFKHIITKSILEQLEITEKASAVRFNKKKEVLYLLSTFIAVLHYKRKIFIASSRVLTSSTSVEAATLALSLLFIYTGTT